MPWFSSLREEVGSKCREARSKNRDISHFGPQIRDSMKERIVSEHKPDVKEGKAL
jgi:hypothetical protein